jgi:ATP-dependent Clp endopeptidase proteolytic subunit ClpP
MPWFKAQAQNKNAEIWINDQIGMDWWSGDGTTAKGFIDAVQKLGDVENIHLRINSPGGDVSDGLTIYNYLRNHAAKVTVTVEGIAASIASVIAMAGDEIIMGVGTTMMVHNPWTWASGNAASFRKVADDLEVITKGLLDAYALKTGKTHDELKALLDGETYLTAQEAVEFGFADRLDVELSAAAAANMDLIKVQVQAKAATAAKDAEILALKELSESLQAKVTAFEKPPQIPDAADVIAYCEENSLTEMATRFIKNKSTMHDVKNMVAKAKDIKSACSKLGISPDKAIDQMDNPGSMIAYVGCEYAAALDLEQSSTLSPGAGTPQAKAPCAKSVYSQLNKS